MSRAVDIEGMQGQIFWTTYKEITPWCRGGRAVSRCDFLSRPQGTKAVAAYGDMKNWFLKLGAKHVGSMIQCKLICYCISMWTRK